MHVGWKYLYELFLEYEKLDLIEIKNYPELSDELKADEEAINQDIQEGKAVEE